MDNLQFDFGKIKSGDLTPEVRYTITNEQIKEYAEFSFDHNPLHMDEEFAKKSIFKGIIAHGTIPLAYIYVSLFKYFGVSWIDGFIINIKLIAPVRPNDNVSCYGKVKSFDNESVIFELHGVNHNKEQFIVGEAVVSRRKLYAES